MTDFTYAVDGDGVATIVWDVAGKSMNVMSTAAFALLSDLVDQGLADAEVKGIILTSGKKDFAGGMDLNTIAQMQMPIVGTYEGNFLCHGPYCLKPAFSCLLSG